ncbi:MAG: SGNH hydrolase domain-containing protein, partial [Pseudomonadota bacterium]
RAPHPNPESSLRRVLNVVGLVLIGGSFIFIEFEHHPGFITVFTVLGTVMIIAFSGGRDLVTRLLASKPFVAIGLMSYSLYLWHYPIFAYARHIQTDITVTDKLIWMALSLALAIPSYRFIEKPFRNRQLVSQRGLWSTTIVLAGLLVAFSLFVIQDKGSRQRFADLETLYGINEFDTRTLKQESYDILAALAEEHGFGPSMPLQASEYESSQLWYSANPDTHKVLIVGVSASIDLFNALYLNQHRLPLFEFARFGISKELRPENVDSLLAAPNFRRADTVLVYMAINGPTVERYQNFVRNLAASGKEIVIVSHPAAFKSKNNESLFDWFLQHSSSTRIDPRELDHLYFQNQDRRSVFLDAIVQALAEELSLPFMNMWDLVCDEQRETCSAITPDGYRTFYDHVHWTTEGADFFGRRIAERGWLETLRQ